MRCAEVMLMYAEAANELSAIPTQEALDALNAVRINANLMGKTLEELSTKEIFVRLYIKNGVWNWLWNVTVGLISYVPDK